MGHYNVGAAEIGSLNVQDRDMQLVSHHVDAMKVKKKKVFEVCVSLQSNHC
jgi:hypothetical protein